MKDRGEREDKQIDRHTEEERDSLRVRGREKNGKKKKNTNIPRLFIRGPQSRATLSKSVLASSLPGSDFISVIFKTIGIEEEGVEEVADAMIMKVSEMRCSGSESQEMRSRGE